MDSRINKYISWAAIEGIIYADLDNPFEALGPRVTPDGLLISAFFPDAVSVVACIEGEERKKYELEKVDESGFFACIITELKKKVRYTFRVEYTAEGGNTVFECKDTYAFEPVVDEKRLNEFEKGICYDIYEFLGAHTTVIDGVSGTQFAVWAPNAMRVSVVGNFNFWDGRRNMMKRIGRYGVFVLFIPGIGEGEIYKYEIEAKGNINLLKADPYAYATQKRPDNASVVADIDGFEWSDRKYMKARDRKDCNTSPMNIYEVHLASWKRPGDDESFYNYTELAPMLCEYVKKMGYTHIELLPIMEHPFDGSWGYQVTGYYAPTARYGKPKEFMQFVDYMHANGIGVILDWVPAHFPKDAFGLARFDGTCLYEHQDPRRGEHPHWGTLIYNYERPQVSDFLIANALFWAEKYHVDGIRMDAVASMLYLNYGKNDGEWLPNKYGGVENLDAVELLKHLNSVMKKRNPSVIMIAEESTAWPNVSGDVENGSLGFTLKWNMGWMNDFLKYMKADPLFRKGLHNCLTFSVMYAYSERFVLVFSHDEVVHGKGSMIQKMPGTYEQKFSNLRTAYSYMMGHPGKKLLFMGQEFAQFSEWNERAMLDWQLIDEYDSHRNMQKFVQDLNKFYLKHPAMYEGDYLFDGFEWINCNDADRSVVSFVRKNADESEMVLCVCNFTPVERKEISVGVPCEGTYIEALNTEAKKYGGKAVQHRKGITAVAEECDGRPWRITFDLPALGSIFFTFEKNACKKE